MTTYPYEEYPIDAAVIKLRGKGVEALSRPELEAALKADRDFLRDDERAAVTAALKRAGS